ncbi:LptF/LptG family permease [Synechococcus sp. W60.1]|uniref:LptF/LptG family permease n=1 Tax=Synechococcus sp. W60.1 TaxID=2964516 RepID=UPI0039C1C04F
MKLHSLPPARSRERPDHRLSLVCAVGLMDRYVLSEMLLPFLFGVGAFTTLVMAVGSLFELVRLVVEAGLSISAALQVFVLRAPGIIVLTFPMSMLLATLLAYGRLSADSEITALRGCGVSLYRLMVPALILSLLVTALTFLFNELVVPVSNRQAATTLNRALNRDPDFRRRISSTKNLARSSCLSQTAPFPGDKG